jgi:hypothetical protein
LAFHQPFQIIGFHSCEKEVGLKVLNGKDYLRPSDNPWDWLGPGVYFWEQNPHRAIQYAEECAKGKQKFSGQITTPFVLGAIIELGYCLNLIEPDSLKIVEEAHNALVQTISDAGSKVAENKGANRALDCAVFKYVHESNVKTGGKEYDTIRSPFHEGGALYKTSNFSKRLHMEVCVLNPTCIKGYFLPLPHETFNPYLNSDFQP